MAEATVRRGIRLVAVERPGYGLSDPQPGRSMLDWADDVAALTDALGMAQFAIIGFSIGSVYALVCAHRLPERVTKIALAGALAPLDAPGVTEGMSPMVSGLYSLARPIQSGRIEEHLRRCRLFARGAGRGHVRIRNGMGQKYDRGAAPGI